MCAARYPPVCVATARCPGAPPRVAFPAACSISLCLSIHLNLIFCGPLEAALLAGGQVGQSGKQKAKERTACRVQSWPSGGNFHAYVACVAVVFRRNVYYSSIRQAPSPPCLAPATYRRFPYLHTSGRLFWGLFRRPKRAASSGALFNFTA